MPSTGNKSRKSSKTGTSKRKKQTDKKVEQVKAKAVKLPGFPNKLDIFSTVWKVIYRDTPYAVGDARASAEPCFGTCNFIDREIEISIGGRERSDIWKTFFHEVLHAVANELGLHQLEELESYESIVDCFSTAIVDITLRNKLKIIV